MLRLFDVLAAILLAANLFILSQRLIVLLHGELEGDYLVLRSFSVLAFSCVIVAYFVWRYRSSRFAR